MANRDDVNTAAERRWQAGRAVDRTLALWRVDAGLTGTQQALTYAALGGGAYGLFEVIRGRMMIGLPLLALGVGGAWYLYSKKQQAAELAEGLREYVAAQLSTTALTQEGNIGLAYDDPDYVKRTATATGWARGGAKVAQSRLDADRDAAIAAMNA